MKIFAIIVNFNRPEQTIACVRSLQKTATNNWQLEIVVVDNASTDNSLKLINKNLSCIKLIESKLNLGFSAGNNLGIKFALQAKADYLLFINNDTLIEKNALLYLVESAKKFKMGGIFSPKIYFAPGREYHKERYKQKELGRVIWYAGGKIDWNNIFGVHRGLDQVDKGQFKQETETEFISGCCMFVKKEVLEKVDFFDERYFLYLEDMDFCVRVKKAGFKLFFVPQAIVWHKNLGTDEKTTVSSQAYFYTRNRLLFGFSYARFRTKIALIRESIKFLFVGNKWQKKGVIDFYLSKFGKGSYQA